MALRIIAGETTFSSRDIDSGFFEGTRTLNWRGSELVSRSRVMLYVVVIFATLAVVLVGLHNLNRVTFGFATISTKLSLDFV